MMCYVSLIILLTPSNVTAQSPADWMGEPSDPVQVLLTLDGRSVTSAPDSDPIIIHMEDDAEPMIFFLAVRSDSDVDLILEGEINFYYQGISVLPIRLITEGNSSEVPISAGILEQNVTAAINWKEALAIGPIDLMTGLFESDASFIYHPVSSPSDVTEIQQKFYLEIPVVDFVDIITSVTGVGTIVVTVTTVYGVGNGLWQLFEGLKTASKLRGIHKKISEIRSLPNLTVIGATPMLFTMLVGMGLMKGKKKTEERTESTVTDYLVRQKLRELAPDAWPKDKCPKCRRNWNQKTNTCKKCKIGEDEARREYADLLASKVPDALKALGNKKSMNVSQLAKKTKSTDYNAGVIAVSLIESGVTEVEKVSTPFRSFLMNTAGLVFVIITWQQLLGDSASQWQTTLTLIGAALSFGVIIALYVARRSQIQKMESDYGTPPTEAAPPSPEPVEHEGTEVEPEPEEEPEWKESTPQTDGIDETMDESEEYDSDEESIEDDSEESGDTGLDSLGSLDSS
jgi:hypothetical protein